MITTVAMWFGLAFILPVWLFGAHHGKPRAIETGDHTPSRSKARRAVRSASKLVDRPYPHIHTLHDLILHAAKTRPTSPGMGARKIVNTVTEEKEIVKGADADGKPIKELKKWNFYELSGFEFMTYTEVKDVVINLGCGLREIGLKAGDSLTLFAATSRDWQLMAHAAWSQAITITTAYDTLGEEGLTFSLNECQISTLFTNADLLRVILSVGSNVPTLKKVIYNGQADDNIVQAIKSKFPHLELYSIEKLKEIGSAHPVETVSPKPEDIALIMYTSGSTGNPKGVLLTHANIIAAVGGAKDLTDTVLTHGEEVYIAYLPLAHVMELVIEQLCICEGYRIGYGGVRTLTDASVRNCKGDLTELRPTIMCGVPAVWETIRKGVAGKLKSASPVLQTVFKVASAVKWQLIKQGIPTGLIDKTVFKKIQEQTGGRLKFALSGGAPMPSETQKFMTVCVCPVVQGYGMTETCAASVIQLPADSWMLGRVGPPTSCVEVTLTAVEDTSYHPHNQPNPQGEIWMRGPSIMQGYHKNPKATAEALTQDGWLMTGDIGEFYPDGTLKIIDRKKNLVKLSNGEYIALEKLESQYKTSTYVHNIMVCANSHESFPVAIVNPIEKEILALAESKGLDSGMGSEELCKNKEVVKAVLADLRQAAKNAGFKPAEILGNVALDPELWTPENGKLTAAQKLKRNELVAANKDKIEAMYKAGRQ